MPEYKTIVAATDFSEAALAGVKHAADLARRLKSGLLLVYVVDARVPPLVFAASSEPTDVILESHRRQAEMQLQSYVVGSHGHGFVGRVLMGSTAERILHIASCPVLVVPSGR